MEPSESTLIQAALEACFAATNEYHHAARALRNRLILMTVIALLAAAGVVVLQLRIPSAKFIGTVNGTAHIVSWQLIVIVMAFGALGALLTTIGPISALPPAATPFNFPMQQAFLKIAVGTLTAMIGAIFFGGTTVTKGFQSLPALVAAAIAFGASQQAVTQFLDKRATTLIASRPSI